MALDTKIHDPYINDLLLFAIILNNTFIIVLKYKSSQQGGWVKWITLGFSDI